MAGPLVCQTAQCKCSMEIAPSQLNPLPISEMMTDLGFFGTLTDNIPFVTLPGGIPLVITPPFALCTSLLNPIVLTATVAAMGVLVPQPCTPVPPAPWIPTQANLIGENSMPVLDSSSQLICAYGGVISIIYPGQVTAIVV